MHFLLGHPGTGKSTWLSRRIADTVERYGPESVMAASFTRTAARNLLDPRFDLPVEPHQVGTIHSFAYNALPVKLPIADTRESIAEFNRKHPEYALTGAVRTIDNPTVEDAGSKANDRLFSRMQCLRNMMVPAGKWPGDVRLFASKWLSHVEEFGIDFTGIIEKAIALDTGPPPGVEFIFLDEAQDTSMLQMTLMSKWAGHAREWHVAGDPNQQLYSFIGVTPETMRFNGLGNDRRTELVVSHRLPRMVRNFAHSLISRAARAVKTRYESRDEDGYYGRRSFTYENVEEIVETADGFEGDTMILASAGYMLDGLIDFMREKGIPFHNPYRPSNGRWNPIRLSGDDGKSVPAWSRISAFLSEPHSPEPIDKVRKWIEPLAQTGLLKRGAKKRLAEFEEETPDAVLWNEIFLDHVFSEESAMKRLVEERDLDFYLDRLTKSKADAYAYPASLAKRYGADVFGKRPGTIVGTIHSTKGAQADNVILFPDLSPAASRELKTPEGWDAAIRMFYVGATRARRNLFLASPATGRCMRLHERI